MLVIAPAADRAFGEGTGVGAADGEGGGALDTGDGGEPGAVEAGDGTGLEKGAAADEGVDALEISGEPDQFNTKEVRALLKENGRTCWGSVTRGAACRRCFASNPILEDAFL